MTSAFDLYQGRVEEDVTEDKPEKIIEDNVRFINRARQLASEEFNDRFPTVTTVANQFYVVWFAKTLGNWKALVSTDLVAGQYWEVTHNGEKRETYVDAYVKLTNRAVPDGALS